jgi:ABC-type proline/glycine betaine transport system permease subunit
MRHATTAVLFLAAISACSKQTPSANPTAPAAKPAAADPLATPLGLANAKLVENADNPLNVAKFELGKQLFFDPRLSGTGAMACAACHLPEKAFTDGNAVSKKDDGGMNTRNSPTMHNVGYLDRLYWDGRAKTLEGNVLAAWKAGGWVDRLVMVFSVVGFSFPVFVLGYLLIYKFSLDLKWLPTQGYRSPFTDFQGFLRTITLPTITLGAIYVALVTRITRASVLEVLGEDYIRTARAKGQNERKVLFRHALKNAAVPIVTVIGIGIALLIGGVVVTESVYAIPGLGRLTVDAVLARDFPTIQGVILLFSFVYVMVNLLVDLSYVFFDPRIRY